VRLTFCAFLAVVAVAAASVSVSSGLASDTTVGDGCVVVQDGFGKVWLNLSRGVVFGRFQGGKVTIEDQTGSDGVPKVTGDDSLVRTKVGENRTSYTGDLVRFRTSGAVKIYINAQFIDLSAVGKGTALLSADKFEVFDNLFSVDSASFCEEGFQEFPAKPTRFPIIGPDTSG
jgi:hypothetical protein